MSALVGGVVSPSEASVSGFSPLAGIERSFKRLPGSDLTFTDRPAAL
jgi:hypothetical protein